MPSYYDVSPARKFVRNTHCMIQPQLIHPKSIVVVGASNQLNKPGGRLLNNLINGSFNGRLMVVNRREREVQGIEAVRDISGLEQVDLAILAIPATQCLEAVKELAYQKGTKAFIIISAGFGELTEKGVRMEQDIVDVVNEVGGNLKHGLFTYALLEVLKGKEVNKSGEKVTISEMKSYVEDRVPELSEKYHGTPQYPTSYSFGQDFPIVILP